MDSTIAGKTVVITGASSGFGKGTALALARAGASVSLAARRVDLLEGLARQCEALGGRARAIPTDVSIREEVESLAQETVDAFGRIDVWINNAGVGAIGRFEQIPIDIHEHVITTDLLGTIYGSYAAWPRFLAQGSGTLINVASELGMHTVPYYSSYAAAKHGVVGLSQTLRQELEQNGVSDVHVCLVMPTAHDTPFFDHAANYTGREVQAPKPLHDPHGVIDALVALVRDPKDEKIVGADGVVKILLKRLAPSAAERISGRQMHKTQFDGAPPAADSRGGVDAPAGAGTTVRGGRKRPRAAGQR